MIYETVTDWLRYSSWSGPVLIVVGSMVGMSIVGAVQRWNEKEWRQPRTPKPHLSLSREERDESLSESRDEEDFGSP